MNDQIMTDQTVSPPGWRNRLRNLRKIAPFASGAVAAFAAILLYNAMFPPEPPLTERQVSEAIAQAMASATPRPALSVQAYEVIRPALVLLETVTFPPDALPDAVPETGLGSGVVINYAGDILTSYHVVAGASQIMVTFADGTRTRGTLISAQLENDIAVVRPYDAPPGMVPAVLGNPNSMRVVSGFDRTFQPLQATQPLDGLIQIDAAANPGNSGGPLINRDGQVVGIIVGIVNPTADNFFIGIAFAVPIDAAGGGAGAPPY
jgi:S1-C subfamily serine protease